MRLIYRLRCHSQRAVSLAGLIGILLLAGCGGDGHIGRYPVTGSVTVDSRPAAAAVLLFCPVGGSPEFQKVRPMGITKDDGTFVLTTFGGSDGAPAGQYKVLITWPAQSKGPSRDGRVEAGPDRLQGRYNNLEKSPFTVEVKSGATNLPPFELKSK
jgi:hypothetical protein